MSAQNIFKNSNEKNFEIPIYGDLSNRKTSIDPLIKNSGKLQETPSALTKLNKILQPKEYNISKIEQIHSIPSKDGMKINLMLNINFNLKGILVS